VRRRAAVAFIAGMIACGPSPEEKTARSADSIVALAAEKGLVFRGVVSGSPVAIMVRDFKVYNLDDKPRSDGVRPVILRPDFYPWPTTCGRESIEGDSAFVRLTIGRWGLGAGACCSTGGTYRSRDGRVWERQLTSSKWVPVVDDSVATSGDSAAPSGDTTRPR
jgi:hypothetical protein